MSDYDSDREEESTWKKFRLDKDVSRLTGNNLTAAVKELADELKGVSGSGVSKNVLKGQIDQFTSRKILQSKSPAVRAYSSCVIMDIWRLSMPESYFNEKQTSAVFHFLLRELRDLKNTTNAYYEQKFYTLERMFESECLYLINSCSNHQKLLIEAFDTFYDICHKNRDETVEFMCSSLLAVVARDERRLPDPVIEMVLEPFVVSHRTYSKYRGAPSKSDNRQISPDSHPCLGLSVTITKDLKDLMTNALHHSVSQLLAPGQSKTDEEDNLETAGTLMASVWHYAPELLASVAGQLEYFLGDENVTRRRMAITTIGEILAVNKTSRTNFVTEYHSAFKAWIVRSLDMSSLVRADWATMARHVMQGLDFYDSEKVCEALRGLLADGDETVRTEACDSLGGLPLDYVSRIGPSLIQDLTFRLRDKKANIRDIAFKVIGNWYSSAYPHFSEQNSEYRDTFGEIPSSILELIYVDDKEVGEQVEKYLQEFIFPVGEIDNDKRAQRVFDAVSQLSELALSSLMAMVERQVYMSKYLHAILVATSNDTTKTESVIQWISVQFSKPEKISAVLKWFLLEDHNPAMKRALSLCLDPDSEYKIVLKSIEMIMKKVGTKADREVVFEVLHRRAAYLIDNRDTLAALMKINKSNANVSKYMEQIAKLEPSLLKSEIDTIGAKIEKLSLMKPSEQIMCLRTASFLFTAFPDETPTGETFWRSVNSAIEEGTPEIATQAVKLLKVDMLDKVLKRMVTMFDKDGQEFRHQPLLSANLACLAQLYKRIPEQVEPHSPTLIKKLLEEILLSNEVEPTSGDGEWVEREELPDECIQKLLVLKILVNRLRSLTEENEAEAISKPVFKCLLGLVENGGDIIPDSSGRPHTPTYFNSHLRLAAGINILRLAREPVYMKIMDPSDINTLVLLVQDTCSEVRWAFVRKLTKYFLNGLPREFLPLLFMAAVDPDPRMQKYVGEWVQSRARKEATYDQTKDEQPRLLLEQSLARLLHMIVHHQDLFKPSENSNAEVLFDDLNKASHYIIFYLTNVASESNLPVLFYIAEQIRKYKDATDKENDGGEKIRLISDLAQRCILRYQEAKGLSLTPWPGRLKMPWDLFELQSDRETAALIPESILGSLDDGINRIIAKYSKSGTVKVSRSGVGRGQRKRPMSLQHGRTKKKRTRRPFADQSNFDEGPIRRSDRKKEKINYEENGLSDDISDDDESLSDSSAMSE